MEILMDALTEKLGIKLQEWKPEISDSAQQTLRELVRQYISEIIDLADRDVLDLLPSRTVEQDMLDLIDEHYTGCLSKNHADF
jgi:hypothetical protein